jgi:tetratricopeptide repeat protein 30
MDEALEMCDKILNDQRFEDAELKKQVNELKAAILYEKNEFKQAIECLNPDDKQKKDI